MTIEPLMRFFRWTSLYFWLAAICYALAAWLFVCFLIVDASFIRPLAPASIDADTFQHVAWGYRFFGLFCIAMTVALFATKRFLWGGITLALAVVCSVILFGHAIGLSFKSMEEQYAAGAVVTTIESVSVEEINEQIADIDKRRDEIRADRDSEVARLQASINGIVNDGLNNDHLADAYRTDQTEAEAAAKDALAALDKQRSDLVAKRQEARTGAATQAVEKVSFNPFFVGLARFSTGQWAPGAQVDETASYTSGLGFFGIFFAFGELLMMLTPGLGSTFLILHYDKRKDWQPSVRYSDDVPEGHVRWTLTDEEAAAYEEALAASRKRKRQSEDKAPAGSPLRLDDKGWKREMKKRIQDAYDQGMSPQEIADEVGLTWHEYENIVVRMFNEKASAKYLGQPAESEPDPRAATPPAPEADEPPAAEPDPDLEIPDEPKEWPVGPHDPNRKPNANGADHDQV